VKDQKKKKAAGLERDPDSIRDALRPEVEIEHRIARIDFFAFPFVDGRNVLVPRNKKIFFVTYTRLPPKNC